MAKQGQHKHDAHDPRVSKGHNKPGLSQPITTGGYKKPETYRKQAIEHKPTNKQAQYAENEWNEDTRDKPSIEGSTRARHPRGRRSGSDSNASSSTRGY